MKVIFAVLLIVFCNFNLFAQSNITKEEYAVYTAVFESISSNEHKSSFVILDKTIEPDFKTLENELKQPSNSDEIFKTNPLNNLTPATFELLLNDFKANNKQLAKVENQFSKEYKFDVISKNDINQLLEDGKKEYAKLPTSNEIITLGQEVVFMWQPFRRKYQNVNGYYNLSRVGFNADKNIALVYFNFVGINTGLSIFCIMEKVNDKWIFRKGFGSGFVDN